MGSFLECGKPNATKLPRYHFVWDSIEIIPIFKNMRKLGIVHYRCSSLYNLDHWLDCKCNYSDGPMDVLFMMSVIIQYGWWWSLHPLAIPSHSLDFHFFFNITTRKQTLSRGSGKQPGTLWQTNIGTGNVIVSVGTWSISGDLAIFQFTLGYWPATNYQYSMFIIWFGDPLLIS